MGLDWWPCRFEPGYDFDELAALLEAEHRRFNACAGYLHPALRPLLGGSAFESGALSEEPWDGLRVHEVVLIKPRECHRVSPVSGNRLLPLAWRLDANRSLLPAQLAERFARWAVYLDAVEEGRYRGYLHRLRSYLETVRLGIRIRDDLEEVSRSAGCTSSWAVRPEVAALRERFAGVTLAPSPTPPGLDLEALRGEVDEARWARVVELDADHRRRVHDWNGAVQRGNRQLAALEPLDESLEAWIEANRWDWFGAFSRWVRPWIEGGYGLYRDCES